MFIIKDLEGTGNLFAIPFDEVRSVEFDAEMVYLNYKSGDYDGFKKTPELLHLVENYCNVRGAASVVQAHTEMLFEQNKPTNRYGMAYP